MRAAPILYELGDHVRTIGDHLNHDRSLERLRPVALPVPWSQPHFCAHAVWLLHPFQIVILPMAQTLGFLGIANSITGLIVVHTVYGISFTTLFFRNYYVSVPQELVRAATMDGAGFFRIFWHIMLPLSLPIIVVSVIWQFTQVWNEFLFGASFTSGGSQPVTVALNNLINSTTSVKQYNVDMAAALIAAAPTLVVYIIAGRFFVRGLTLARSKARGILPHGNHIHRTCVKILWLNSCSERHLN